MTLNLIGQRFGKLIVIERDVEEESKHGKGVYWKCNCDCGGMKTVITRSLIGKGCSSCGCKKIECINSNRPTKKEFGISAFNEIYYRYEKRAEDKGISFSLTRDNFKILIKGNCYYCGSEPHLIKRGRGKNGNFTYNGIDRINSSIGYIENNVVSCCSTCNYAKRTMGQQEFLQWVERVYKHSILKE